MRNFTDKETFEPRFEGRGGGNVKTSGGKCSTEKK